MSGAGGSPGNTGHVRRRGSTQRRLLKERLSRRAVQLFRERGFDDVTVDDIAAAEHSSRSTFFRYFGTKEEAVVSRLDEFGEAWRDRYDALLAEDEPWFALSRCALSTVRHHAGDPQLLDLMQLLWETPALRRRLTEKLEEWRLVFEAMTRDRLGLPETDLVPGLVTHSVIGATMVATGIWVRTGGQGDLIDLLDKALAIERRGWSATQPPSSAQKAV